MPHREKIEGKFQRKSNTNKNKFLEEIAAKIAQKSNIKNKKIWRKMLRKSYFLKKKKKLTYARFSLKKKNNSNEQQNKTQVLIS